MTLPLSQQWQLVIHQSKGQFPFIAYAVHGKTGKVEREGRYQELDSAITAGGDLVRMLNLHHPYAGKYRGTDKLVGKRVNPEKVAARAAELSARIQRLVQLNEKLFRSRKRVH